MSNQYLEIVASNTTSTGTLSYKNGQPVISFIIGEQERFLLGNSLRLTGNFAVLSDDATLGSANARLWMDGRTSIYSTIDQLVIKSQKTNQTIEHIRNYNRFMASYLSVTSDKGDAMSHLNQSACTVPSPNMIKYGNAGLAGAAGGIVDNEVNLGNDPNSFCLDLPCGLLSGTGPIPLSGEWGVGGLLVEIHLAPDSNVLFDEQEAAANIANAFYEFKNVTLTCEVQRPTPEQRSALSKRGGSGGTFEYNSISSYYTTINSTNAIINFSLGLSRVLGVFCNFIGANQINNRAFNGMSTWYPLNANSNIATINQLVFTRGGERMPLEYNIDTLQRTDAANLFPDEQITRNYINAIQSFFKNTRNSITPQNMRMTDGGAFAVRNQYVNGGCAFGIGVAFDTISNQGIDFRTTNFGINMDMDLTSDNPNAVYMFVHSKQTLVFNQNGITVVT
tara:strand:- start:62 stop:1408 length:1347 start_codon:yes stop_codon:yes gene_type:complete